MGYQLLFQQTIDGTSFARDASITIRARDQVKLWKLHVSQELNALVFIPDVNHVLFGVTVWICKFNCDIILNHILCRNYSFLRWAGRTGDPLEILSSPWNIWLWWSVYVEKRRWFQFKSTFWFISEPDRIKDAAVLVDTQQFVRCRNRVEVRFFPVVNKSIRLPNPLEHFDTQTECFDGTVEAQALILPWLNEGSLQFYSSDTYMI